MGTRERLIVIVLFDRVDLLDVTGPPEVFSLLQREMDEPTGYRVVLAAETMDPVTTSAGVRVLPDATFEDVSARRIDTLVVPGAVETVLGAADSRTSPADDSPRPVRATGDQNPDLSPGIPAAESPRRPVQTVADRPPSAFHPATDNARRVRAIADPVVVDRVRRLAGNTRRIASVCVGAHILAAAGLLDGKRATTHWSTARQLAAEHPAIEVDADPIFIRDGNVWTGAGLSACLDLALALVADDFGEAMALRVARQLVMYLKRPSGQNQFSVSLDPVSTTRRIDDLRVYITQHITDPLTVADLAERAHVGERQLTRIFKTDLGTTPAAYLESARVEAARNRLETTDDTLDRIASTCGFNTTDTLTRAFRRQLDTTPAEYRARFRIG
ncbi:GlxA family transcriptional regulator [Nocardia mexicana]|uniref:Transcriptional regulator GlxA family with amidase domain n=1 Tax=Nocardia mexicana TaxID=279262 RepID=A0A370GR28_9NOCA|nr:DJ-1/PfpI family protein [Nocardia mexicana]RDI46147.1 transcriptional regulator GlxA family with amidase domain [Nocardia mexicana]